MEGSSDDCFYRLSFSMLCWLGKPLNVQPDFAQLVLLFLLAWSRKERKAHEWPIPGGRPRFCFCLVRPLRSHYWLCSSLYPQGNPMHWDSRLDHHQTQEWALNQWNVCFYLSSSPLLIKSQSQVEVETRDQINLWTCCAEPLFQPQEVQRMGTWLPLFLTCSMSEDGRRSERYFLELTESFIL